MPTDPEPLLADPDARAGLSDGPIPRAERWAAALFLFAAFLLRCFYIFRFRYDSDEPQHLHTTWGWTQGLIQYRDFFDNHTPLFHLLFSPLVAALVAALGERTDILTFMRFAMVPLWFVALGAVWWIGSRAFSRRAGLWAAVFTALLPWWFFCALEYRTDNLWAPLWLCSLAVLLSGRLTWQRAFAGGFLLGICACTSMKTSLLLAVSTLAAVAAPQLCARRFDAAALVRMLKIALPILAGLVLVPAAVCAFFAAKGCWDDFVYCVIKHNVMLDVDAKVHHWYQRFAFPIALPFLLYGASLVARRAPSPSLARRRTFLFLFPGLYYVSLESFWALLTRQDYLPFYPLAAIAATPLLLWVVEKALARYGNGAALASRRTGILCAVALVGIVIILWGRPPWKNGTLDEQEILREALALTRPGEYVMDFKGECVFRPRAFRYVVEPLTYRRMSFLYTKRDRIQDTIPQDVLAKNVHVVVNRDRWYQKPTIAFLTENFLNIGQLRVAGRFLSKETTLPGAPVPFTVTIPARYVLWAEGQPVRGLLDGTPYTGARELSAGSHTFLPDAAYRKLTLFWERAAQAGYSPAADQSWQYER